MSRLSTLNGISTSRQEIKRSRFAAVAAPVASEEAAKAFIDAHSDPAANHNCWAWRIGQTYRSNDDGEPSGTAGRPILQAIDGQALDRVAVVVTRWFGGILLGSGGLIRAYGGTAAMCLREAGKIALVEETAAVVSCSFGDLSLVLSRLGDFPDVHIRPPTFNEGGAVVSASIPKAAADDISRMLGDLTSGRAVLRVKT